jgi:NHL repeat
MRYSIHVGPVTLHGGHSRRKRPPSPGFFRTLGDMLVFLGKVLYALFWCVRGIVRLIASHKLDDSRWIAWTFTIVLNWVAFLYIGFRAREFKWILTGAAYAVFVVINFSLAASAGPNSRIYTGANELVVIAGIASIVHAFYVRKPYLLQMREQHDRTWKTPSTRTVRGAIGIGIVIAVITYGLSREAVKEHRFSSTVATSTAVTAGHLTSVAGVALVKASKVRLRVAAQQQATTRRNALTLGAPIDKKAACFNWPNGLTVDSTGNIFVLDSGNSTGASNEIDELAPNGVLIRKISPKRLGLTQDDSLDGISRVWSGTALYVSANFGSDVLQVDSRTERVLQRWTTYRGFNDFVADAHGNLYTDIVSKHVSNTTKYWSAPAGLINKWTLPYAKPVTLDHQGIPYSSDRSGDHILELDPGTGRTIRRWSGIHDVSGFQVVDHQRFYVAEDVQNPNDPSSYNYRFGILKPSGYTIISDSSDYAVTSIAVGDKDAAYVIRQSNVDPESSWTMEKYSSTGQSLGSFQSC